MNIGTMNIDNLLAVITEDEAIRLYNDLSHKFSWIGTVFTTEDFTHSITQYRSSNDLEALSDAELDDAVETVAGLCDSGMADRLCEIGWDIIDTTVREWLVWQ